MTNADLNAAIASGEMTVTKLPTRQPRSYQLVMTRVGGSKRSRSQQGIHPEGSLIKGLVSSDQVKPKRRMNIT